MMREWSLHWVCDKNCRWKMILLTVMTHDNHCPFLNIGNVVQMECLVLSPDWILELCECLDYSAISFSWETVICEIPGY